jgi:hypothetical protein
VLYTISKSDLPDRNELWIADVGSGQTQPLLPGFRISGATLEYGYDISPDGRHVVAEAIDRDGKSRIWVAPLDRRSPPRQLPHIQGDGVLFAANGDIIFRGREGAYGFAYRVNPDGTGLRKVSEHPVIGTRGISLDGKWLVTYARANEQEAGGTLALPLDGGPAIKIFGAGTLMRWSRDGKLLFITLESARTYVLSLPAGKMLPLMSSQGFKSESEIAALAGHVIDSAAVAPGAAPELYAFTRQSVQRNLYRIPVP